MGLPWGFLFAGAHSVVASLSNVDDRSTALLMEDFYRNMLEENMPKAEALHAAKKTLRHMTRAKAE